MKHVIIGAGAAGISAARTLRKQSAVDEIVMIATDRLAYSRCMLHKYIGGERDEKGISFVEEDFFESNRIRFCSDRTVTKIDTSNHQVCFADGVESYDKLLIATGAESFFPPIPGLKGAKNVFGLRDLVDARAIKSQGSKAKHVVVIGAGLVGLDVAYGLLEMGKKPTVVEMADTILSSNLDASAALTYQMKFEEAGCMFKLGCKVEGVLSDASGQVSAITLGDGSQLNCDLLVVASGVRPSIGWLADSGIVCERGVVVDNYLATNIANVYAAGDVTGLSESWPNAVEQGEVAAQNMLGMPNEYTDTFSLKNTIHFFGIPSLSVGRLNGKEGDVEESREDRKRYQKVILRDGIPVGVILQGDISRSGFWQQLIKNKVDVSGRSKDIWKVSFADSYGIEDNGEYKWLFD
ncbi:MAG: FAD-dependent oxidoreductase [Lachnospiraceae bacterium]|nr:FAD-dependent oxidoreductase [Lachnospiraceae bacterium]